MTDDTEDFKRMVAAHIEEMMTEQIEGMVSQSIARAATLGGPDGEAARPGNS